MEPAEIKFRECLYCETEIAMGRPNKSNFCNGRCLAKFRAGMSQKKYYEAVAKNSLVPIRNQGEPPKVTRDKTRYDSLMHKLCQLSEYGRCNRVFPTYRVSQLFCEYAHQVKYNDLKKQERRALRAKRNGN